MDQAKRVLQRHEDRMDMARYAGKGQPVCPDCYQSFDHHDLDGTRECESDLFWGIWAAAQD